MKKCKMCGSFLSNTATVCPRCGVECKEESEVKVYLNGDLITTMEPSKKHTIPVYGLFEDYENIVELEIGEQTQEYKIKTNELYGEDAEDRINENIAKDKYERIEIIDDNILFYDEFSKRFFTSTKYKVKEAEYKLNRDIHMRGWAELNEFYEYLDMDNIDGGEVLGWSEGGNLARYWQGWIDFSHKKSVMDDGTEYIRIIMFQEPYMEYEDE